jgi:hypothetical protein
MHWLIEVPHIRHTLLVFAPASASQATGSSWVRAYQAAFFGSIPLES